MFRYLTRAISRAVGFSKVESRGTLILILILFSALILLNWRIYYLKSNHVPIVLDSTTVDWVLKTKEKISIRESTQNTPEHYPQHNEVDKPKFEKKDGSHGQAKAKTYKEALRRIDLQDLNKASIEELQLIQGIGPVLSERIAKFRDKLGGFVSEEQIHEVYGLDSLVIGNLLHIYSIQSAPKKIAINTDSLRELASHPYISYDLARIIMNYRKANGDIRNVDDLKKIKALDAETFTRLKPYLE